MKNWIKVTEKLPKDDEEVIFRNCDGYQTYGYYSANNKRFYSYEGDYDTIDDCVAWYPIPKFDLE